MSRCGIRVGDEVQVIGGDDKGKQGRVLQVLRTENQVLVSGVCLQKKHLKKSSQHPEGIILERETPIHRSKVRKISDATVKRN
ncbi:MAG: 50S ribosomal protein L24 [Puniceicoccales bacterium]|jgi:large subunit ribosomal protein L24|nr:50S ribosomal protein L24 [Puniceicoccales bacterium]